MKIQVIGKMLVILMLLFGSASPAFAATGNDSTDTTAGFKSFNNAGTDAKESAKQGFQAWIWVLSFVPIGISWFYVTLVMDWLKDEERQGNKQPRPARLSMIVGAIILGVFTAFVAFGIIGVVFFGQSMGDMWKILVLDVFAGFLPASA